MLEAGGVVKAQRGLEGVMGTTAPVHGASARSVSFPRLPDGRRSFCRTASSWRRSATSALCKEEESKYGSPADSKIA